MHSAGRAVHPHDTVHCHVGTRPGENLRPERDRLSRRRALLHGVRCCVPARRARAPVRRLRHRTCHVAWPPGATPEPPGGRGRFRRTLFALARFERHAFGQLVDQTEATPAAGGFVSAPAPRHRIFSRCGCLFRRETPSGRSPLSLGHQALHRVLCKRKYRAQPSVRASCPYAVGAETNGSGSIVPPVGFRQHLQQFYWIVIGVASLVGINILLATYRQLLNPAIQSPGQSI